MAKDPAVLFYFQDFLVGTEFMADEEVGKYIRILCHQADKGALTESQVLRICRTNTIPAAILEKLSVDDEGKYYQKRMKTEKEKREKHIEHQRNNANKRWNKEECHGNATAMPLENENENENRNIIKNENKNVLNIVFDDFWNLYDKKVDRKKCEPKWARLKDAERELCMKNLPSYIDSTPDKKYRRDPETYLNNRSWENEIISPEPVKVKTPLSYDEILKLSEKNPDIWKDYRSVLRPGERKAVFIPLNI